jgi:hypothetical protein
MHYKNHRIDCNHIIFLHEKISQSSISISIRKSKKKGAITALILSDTMTVWKSWKEFEVNKAPSRKVFRSLCYDIQQTWLWLAKNSCRE